MKIFITLAIGAAAIGLMWYFATSKRYATPAVQLPTVPLTQNPRNATGTKSAGCAIGTVAGAVGGGTFGVPPVVGGAVGCLAGAMVQKYAPTVGRAAWSATKEVGSTAKSVAKAIIPGW